MRIILRTLKSLKNWNVSTESSIRGELIFRLRVYLKIIHFPRCRSSFKMRKLELKVRPSVKVPDTAAPMGANTDHVTSCGPRYRMMVRSVPPITSSHWLLTANRWATQRIETITHGHCRSEQSVETVVCVWAHLGGGNNIQVLFVISAWTDMSRLKIFCIVGALLIAQSAGVIR